MHAGGGGGGLRSKLELTSRREELLWTGCCYLLCVYCVDVCPEEDAGVLTASPAYLQTSRLLVLLVLSCVFTASRGRQVGGREALQLLEVQEAPGPVRKGFSELLTEPGRRHRASSPSSPPAPPAPTACCQRWRARDAEQTVLVGWENLD